VRAKKKKPDAPVAKKKVDKNNRRKQKSDREKEK